MEIPEAFAQDPRDGADEHVTEVYVVGKQIKIVKKNRMDIASEVMFIPDNANNSALRLYRYPTHIAIQKYVRVDGKKELVATVEAKLMNVVDQNILGNVCLQMLNNRIS